MVTQFMSHSFQVRYENLSQLHADQFRVETQLRILQKYPEVLERHAIELAARHASAVERGLTDWEIRSIDEDYSETELTLQEAESAGPESIDACYVELESVYCTDDHKACMECKRRCDCLNDPRVPFQRLWHKVAADRAEIEADPVLGPKLKKVERLESLAEEQRHSGSHTPNDLEENKLERLLERAHKARQSLNKALDPYARYCNQGYADSRERTDVAGTRLRLERVYKLRFGEDLAAICASMK